MLDSQTIFCLPDERGDAGDIGVARSDILAFQLSPKNIIKKIEEAQKYEYCDRIL